MYTYMHTSFYISLLTNQILQRTWASGHTNPQHVFLAQPGALRCRCRLSVTFVRWVHGVGAGVCWSDQP